MNYIERAREVLDIEIEELQHARDRLNEGFAETVTLALAALDAGGRIILTGVGKNLPIARKIAATLTSTGAPASVLHPLEAMHGDLGVVRAGDLALALSFSGASEELLALVPLLRRAGAKIVALTGAGDNPLAHVCDARITVGVEREACPFNLAPTASTTATLAIGDALAMVLLEARGFGRDDYARLHPGGAIGRALLLRVADIMRTGDRLAVAPVGAHVRDAIVAMTRARAGAVAIAGPEGRIAGIFTDGDLRRHLDDSIGLAERPIREVMTPDPIRLRSDRLAVDALMLFEHHNIDDLVVVDGDDRIVGMVDIQDLPKMKIL
jgi:arabinose-5-phosphate isomerase